MLKNKFLNTSKVISNIIDQNNISEKILARFYMSRHNRGNFYSDYDEDFVEYMLNNKEKYIDKTIFEAGCGIGQNLILLSEYEFETVAIEPSNRVVVMKKYNESPDCKKKIVIEQKSFPRKEEGGDVIFMGNILSTHTSKNFETMTDNLFKFKEIFISKKNFFGYKNDYSLKWHEYFLLECEKNDYNILDIKNLYFASKDNSN